MMNTMNHRQKALMDELFTRVHEQFSGLVRTEEVRCSPDDPNHIWIFATGQMSAEEESAVQDLTGEIEAEILEQYGYRISLMLLIEPLEELVAA
jgi:hypothetical protein